MDDIVQVIAENIKKARKALKISQAAAARESGITPAYMCLIENGKQKAVTFEVAVRLAEVLKDKPDHLFSDFPVKIDEYTKRFLTMEEKEKIAAVYMDWVREIARETCKYFDMDFEESYSAALVSFCEALNSCDLNKVGNIKTYIAQCIKVRAVSHYRKQTAEKRTAEFVYLDEYRSGYESEKLRQYHEIISDRRQNTEKSAVLRCEIRELLNNLPAKARRREPEIRELAAAIGI